MTTYKILRILFPFIICLAGTSALSQINKIHISGTLDSTITERFKSEDVYIKIHNFNDKLTNSEQLLKVTLDKKRAFSINIDASDSFQYISFWMINSGKDLHSSAMYPIQFPFRKNRGLDEMYLFQAGDSINIAFQAKGHNRFKGSGSIKATCQFQIYNVEPISKSLFSRAIQLSQLGRYYDQLNLENDATDLSIKTRQKILESYREQLPQTVYDILSLDLVAEARYNALSKLHLVAYSSSTAIQPMQLYYKTYLKKDTAIKIEEIQKSQSLNYLEYLFEKEWNTYKLLYSKNFQFGDSFKVLYNIIKNKYEGNLRDKLLTIAVRRLKHYFPDEVKLLANELITLTSDEKLKSRLIQFLDNQKSAFPFELEDVNGKKHKLSDYRGKVIVIDFWFTGCHWCKLLNAAMDPIVEKYRHNKNIVFLSISSDKQKEKWMGSIASGHYTLPKTVNLYTNGLGMQHPLMKHYKFEYAPTQLIIDKNGELINSSPPRPDTGLDFKMDKTTKKYTTDTATLWKSPYVISFIKLINDNL